MGSQVSGSETAEDEDGGSTGHEEAFLVDNTELRTADPGLAYRLNRNMGSKDSSTSPAVWGTVVHGHDCGGGWVQVGSRFLPMEVAGARVLVRPQDAGGLLLASWRGNFAAAAEPMVPEGQRGLSATSRQLQRAPALDEEDERASCMGRGPQRISRGERRCTDAACLLAFVACLSALGFTYRGARAEGDLDKLTHGFDWKGDICGVDEEVRFQPFLYWCSMGDSEELAFIDGVCVERCPFNDDDSTWCPGQVAPFEYRAPTDDGKQQVMIGMVRNLTLHKNYASTEALGYCFPTANEPLLRSILQRTHLSSFTKQVWLAGSGAVANWRFLLCVAAACVVIGYAFLFILWCFFDKLIYGMVIAAHVLLILSIAVLVYAGFNEKHNFFAAYWSGQSARLAAWGCAALLLIVWVLFTMLCCYSRDALNVTIDSVSATCEVITQLPVLLLQPLVHSIVVVATLLLLVYGFAWVLSTGKVAPMGDPVRVQGGLEIAGMQRSIELTDTQWVQAGLWLFGLVWIFETVNALGQFAISNAVVSYSCFQVKDMCSLLQSYIGGVSYHLGTFAFGGFVLGCLKILAAVMAILARQARNDDGTQSAVARMLCCCCAGFTECVERLVSMVNDLIYTDIALNESSYLEAAENVVQIVAGSPAVYAAIKGSATAVRVLGVTIIGGGGTFLSYQALSSREVHQELEVSFQDVAAMLPTSNILGTTIAAGVVCFYVAIAFMMVFYQTTYSLMYCMLIGAARTSSGTRSPAARSPKVRFRAAGPDDKL